MKEIIIYTNETCPYCKQIKEELTKIRNEKFKDQPLPTAEQARKLIEKVETGEDADAVVTEFYLEKK